MDIDLKTRHYLSVCPHDTAKNIAGWFLLNQYLQRRLSARIHFEPQDNFLRERETVLASDHHIVYANPYSALVFMRQRGFVPIARPVDVFDETFLVARTGMNRDNLPERPKVASATDKLVIHNLGITLLPQVGLEEARVDFVFKGNHLNAAKAVITSEAELGFVFNETWNGMSTTARSELIVLAQTKQRLAYHCFMVGPSWANRADEVRDVLCSMSQEAKGRHIVEDLRFTQGFEPIPDDGMERLAEVSTP